MQAQFAELSATVRSILARLEALEKAEQRGDP